MTQDEIIRMARERANAILFDLIGNPDWDKPCTEEHLINFAATLRCPCFDCKAIRN